jgi:SAM-dependent methyltransferase
MTETACDNDIIHEHRRIWSVRPELREVYHEWFGRLLAGMARPVVEIGSGPGFLKQFFSEVITTDVIVNPWINVGCEAEMLPFGAETVGGIVLVDVLHHLRRPMDFIREAKRVLRPNGTLAMVEPWISPLSFFLWRYLHHEECRFNINIEEPFGRAEKQAFEGNAAIPFKLLRSYDSLGAPLRLEAAEPFVGFPYLATRGFRPKGSVSNSISKPLRPLAATRVLLIFRNSEVALRTDAKKNFTDGLMSRCSSWAGPRSALVGALGVVRALVRCRDGSGGR